MARIIEDLWKAIGTICDLFDHNECRSYLNAAGYAANWSKFMRRLMPAIRTPL